MMKQKSCRSGYTLVELAVMLVICGILAAILVPIWARNRESQRSMQCQSNLQRISLAILQYALDNDKRFPLVANHQVTSRMAPFAKPYGWADTIQIYLNNTMLLQCPADEHPTSADSTQNGFTDYWYNANLSSVPQNRMLSPNVTFLLGDGDAVNGVTDARYHIRVAPPSWQNSSQNPALRHFGGMNWAYADGHVANLTSQSDGFSVLRTLR